MPALYVTFSEPINPSSFTYQAITFSKAVGANLIGPGITIQQLSATEFEVGNFENLVAPIDGVYTFTVNAADVEDLAGNIGTGSSSVSWDLITIGPAAPTDLAVSPGVSVSAAATHYLYGYLDPYRHVDQTGLLLDVTTGRRNALVTDAPIQGESISAPPTLSQGGNDLRSRRGRGGRAFPRRPT